MPYGPCVRVDPRSTSRGSSFAGPSSAGSGPPCSIASSADRADAAAPDRKPRRIVVTQHGEIARHLQCEPADGGQAAECELGAGKQHGSGWLIGLHQAFDRRLAELRARVAKHDQ